MAGPVFLNHPQPYRLTATDFIGMANAGLFENNTRTELLEGEIYTMNALFRPHAYNHSELVFALRSAISDRREHYAILTAASVVMAPDSVPEPDIVVAAGKFNVREAVTIDMVRIAIEIADSTVAHDLVRKGRLYARHCVPEYWVVDLGARIIHQLWQPEGDYFVGQAIVQFGDEVTAKAIERLTISTADLI